MPSSLRERLLQAVVLRLTPVATAAGARVIRSPTTAIPRETSPALLLVPESDSIVARPNDRVERHLLLRLTALARDQGDTRAEEIADHLLVAAHAALFAGPDFDGLALGLQEMDCDWEVEDADATATAIPARYQITYRTFASDLARQG